MDLKLIKNILDLIADSDVNEVSLEEGDFKIKVKKQGEVQQVSYTQPAAPQPPAQPAAPATQQPAAPSSGQDDSSSEAADGDTVTSPIVGTFYESPSPDSDPFVKVGDKVSKGDTLCIVEAMKIMNEIEAEFGGTVKKIIAKDGQPVEFEQPLFIIKKD
ncbi:MAG: acetyl-CoA carboxylase, biotin carboxyl carrier protein [Balneola sp.]|jgi:acetyl-CoA carboxylase biotin carboxyl carrier protein|nr:acetyl-CoA carboxylase, biotin carboxyl carrier protein [Balneola sp.]MBE79638.1 acetyl-CoA carboxylase, biotin carboxyl carrier protein [Balneola sp.]HBX67681.1 acetyl-CoA carboxylase biotin carboxyl carrier protein [Balneolaceae bacterium]|tara:strand:- start:726 stop:1202 length:477 start_codon:yes stop_codon:yes gene_type:complete